MEKDQKKNKSKAQISLLFRKLPHASAGGRGDSDDPGGALQAHDVGAERARHVRGAAAAASLPAGQQHGSAQPWRYGHGGTPGLGFANGYGL